MIAQKLGPKVGEIHDDLLRRILPGIGSKARALLQRALNESEFDGTLSAKEVGTIAGFESKSVSSLTVEMLPLAAIFARPSISNFHVGALLRGASGRLYFGSNVELAGQTLAATVHAEQSAAANAYMHQEEGISELAVTSAPCGLCRQFLWEMCYGAGLQVMTHGHPPASLASLLPDAFGPKDLGLQRGALPITRTALQLRSTRPNQLAAAALGAAQMSYAPYTKAYAGVAIKTSQGRVYRGSYIENAAYNPSLSPFQVALAGLVAAGDDPTRIVQAALVEVPGGPVNHRRTTEVTLSTVSPSADLSTLVATAGR